MQTVETLIRRQIWICTVCLCPQNGTLGIKGLTKKENISLFEPPHDKTNKMACAPSEDSDQTGHPSSLIRVFAVRMKKGWILSCPLCAQADLSLRWVHMLFCWFCHEVAHFQWGYRVTSCFFVPPLHSVKRGHWSRRTDIKTNELL